MCQYITLKKEQNLVTKKSMQRMVKISCFHFTERGIFLGISTQSGNPIELHLHNPRFRSETELVNSFTSSGQRFLPADLIYIKYVSKTTHARMTIDVWRHAWCSLHCDGFFIFTYNLYIYILITKSKLFSWIHPVRSTSLLALQ